MIATSSERRIHPVLIDFDRSFKRRAYCGRVISEYIFRCRSYASGKMPNDAIALTTILKTALFVRPSLMYFWYWGCPQNQSVKSSRTSRIRERKLDAAVWSE